MVTEVNKGYVKYEVGEFPEDWVLKNFNDIFSFHSTSNYSKAEMSSEGSVGCIHYGLIHAIPNTHYDLSDGIKFYVTEEQSKYDYVKDGDVIMVDASEDISGVNKSVEVFGVGERKYISGLHTYLIRDSKSNLADRFRGIILNSTVIKNQMIQLAVGMKVFGVSKTQLINIKIPLPPTIEEQKSIATALTDVDELITGLEKLISKKKDIKQGSMQQLLTPPDKGGKRLPGFSGEWIKESIKSIVSTPVTDGPHETPKFVREGVPFLSVNNIVNNRIDYSDLRYITKIDDEIYSKKCKPIKNDILLGKAASVGKVAVVDKDWDFNIWSPLALIRCKNNYSPYFVFYSFQTKEMYKQIDGLTNSSSQGNIGMGDIEKLEIFFPKYFNEQQAIAKVLRDMDEEITQLETKKEKYEAIKQGMMQELLTGKTRLV